MKRKIKDVDTMMESNEKIENNISTNTKTNVHDNNNTDNGNSNNNDSNGDGKKLSKKKKKRKNTILPRNIEELESFSRKDLGKYCKAYIKAMLERWENELLARPPEVKNSGQGRAATRQFKECKNSMKQFFKGCKAESIHIDVVGGVSKIVLFLQTREYVKAHDQYMLMAIGNAPWPIGVTAVGIHDRTGRERIGSNKIAHIMDDEGTRKSLNAIKRILTYCQKVFPTDPSKMVFN